MFSCDWVMRDNPGDQVIPYRCIVQPKAEGNCQVPYGTYEFLMELVQLQLQALLQPSHSIQTKGPS